MQSFSLALPDNATAGAITTTPLDASTVGSTSILSLQLTNVGGTSAASATDAYDIYESELSTGPTTLAQLDDDLSDMLVDDCPF